MKLATVILTIVVCSAFTTNAQQVKWYTFEQALELNKKEPRNIIIDVYTDWCGWCKVMDQKTFSLPKIAKILNEKYYPVKFNAETKDTIVFQGHEFKSTFQGNKPPHELAVALLQGKLSYPNIVFLNKKNQVLGAIPGFQKPEPMEAILDYMTRELYLQNVDLGKHMEEYKTK